MLEEREANDAVVGALVFDERSCPELGRAVECAVCSRRVEDLVDTGMVSRQTL